MHRLTLTLLTDRYLPLYTRQQPLTLTKQLAQLQKKRHQVAVDDYLIMSAIYSARIEGCPLCPQDYYWAHRMHIASTPWGKPVDDLLSAYQFARQGPLTGPRLQKAHYHLSATLLSGQAAYRGAYRQAEVSIQEQTTRRVVYQAARADQVSEAMEQLLADMNTLSRYTLSPTEIFYYAAQVHLRVAQIHPFVDGNGRLARLVEKWFLVLLLGEVGWQIESERYYECHQGWYYQSLQMGPSYDQLNDDQSLPFLLLLPWSLRLRAKWSRWEAE